MYSVSEIWKLASSDLREQIEQDYYERWMGQISPIRLEKDTIVLGVPSSFFQDWLSDNYRDVIHDSIKKMTELDLKVVFESGHELPKQEKSQTVPQEKKQANVKKATAPQFEGVQEMRNLDRRYTFDSFVVGANSQFAYTACMSVATEPGKRMNPLFIHSSTGLGKTHLLQAIAHKVTQEHPELKVMYTTSEELLNMFLDAVYKKNTSEFRKKIREQDVLLIDDIQFLSGKEAFQEEIFHTFNTLFNANKQIVMTSDRPPHEIENLEKRLISRFEWGLTTDIQQPDLETRIAIIHKKQEDQSCKLDEEVVRYVAARLKSNVRRLESGIFKLVSWSSLSNIKIDKATAEKLLSDVFSEEAGKIITVEEIQRIVSEHYEIRLADMTSNKRPANIAVPRMIAMFLSRKMTENSLPTIADKFARNHATVMHAVSTIEKKISASDDFKRELDKIERKINSL